MASPAAIGAGIVGGTAVIGATSTAIYQALHKDDKPEENKNLTDQDPKTSQSAQAKGGQQTENTSPSPNTKVVSEGENVDKRDPDVSAQTTSKGHVDSSGEAAPSGSSHASTAGNLTSLPEATSVETTSSTSGGNPAPGS
ncbi:hypothetical protein [Candidatus Mycoplasma haematohominis]|uniref:hypothetical protein n=1 Tax=Candidatus Mycoplasma haematohominis TaxID=1494318 RepID=UPI001C0A7671|nr:hypothetical protein [Candidatus Mycoplasma haemohominis]